MIPQQFGGQSGVIVDACKYHGVWFDADELPRILDWVRCGGLARANEDQRSRELQEVEQRRRMARLEAALASDRSPVVGPGESLLGAALSMLASYLNRRI